LILSIPVEDTGEEASKTIHIFDLRKHNRQFWALANASELRRLKAHSSGDLCKKLLADGTPIRDGAAQSGGSQDTKLQQPNLVSGRYLK
jgi:hypothetical protein